MAPRNIAVSSLPGYAVSVPQNRRVLRKPSHPFQIETRPFAITPFMLAPVLPGETLQNFQFQSRCVTDPIKNPLIGWWQEYYWFYVPFDAMEHAEDIKAAMLDPSSNLTGLASGSTVVENYVYQGGIDWVAECTPKIIQKFFRRPSEVEDGTWDDYKLGNYHVASINRDDWTDSLIDATVLTEGGDLPDDAANATIGDVDRMTWMYEAMRQAQLTDMDFDKFIATFGVKLQTQEDPREPELLRYSRDWQYPSNTVDPATGIPASAVSWATAVRADKQRYFKWPGFIIGFSVSRPKVYFNKQVGAAAGALTDVFAWLPALLQDKPEISLREFAADVGPLFGNTTNGYVFDIRDLYLYGDQFINFALTETDQALVGLPTVALQHRYPASADVDALFKAASPANKIRQDGICSLDIAGRQTDQT